MTKDRYDEIKENVCTRCSVAVQSGIGKTTYDREELELIGEIERLNNIINKFDKWLFGEQMMFYSGSDNERLIRFEETKDKWLKIKESEVE